jgi:very-short-patch-repair endonuclease
MTQELPNRSRVLLAAQEGTVARWQLPLAGISSASVQNLLRCRRWQRIQPGVYAAFTGPPSRLALLWAAVLWAGPDAILSHESAAEVYGLARTQLPAFHVTIPARRRKRTTGDIIVHRSRRLEQVRFRGTTPPCAVIDETVFDLVDQAAGFDEAFGWLSRACQQGLTSPGMLRVTAGTRKRVRWRREIEEALGDVAEGVHSPLEMRYVRDVERRHGLPRARRQAQVIHVNARRYLDQLYDDFALCVELDGQAAHPAAERWRDINRDNLNAAAGIQTLRFGWRDVARPCMTALVVARVLERRGWSGELRRCGPSCALPRLAAKPLWEVTGGSRR